MRARGARENSRTEEPEGGIGDRRSTRAPRATLITAGAIKVFYADALPLHPVGADENISARALSALRSKSFS